MWAYASASVDMVSLSFATVNDMRDKTGRILIGFTHHQALAQVSDGPFGWTASKVLSRSVKSRNRILSIRICLTGIPQLSLDHRERLIGFRIVGVQTLRRQQGSAGII